MFDFFRKKLSQEKNIAAEIASEISDKQPSVEIGADVTIHAMPERFRSEHIKVSQAKTTGLFIIVGGIIFLLIISAVGAYLLFGSKASQSNKQTAGTTAAPSQEQASENTATEPAIETATTTANLPAVASSTLLSATTTEELISGATELTAGQDSDNDGLTDKEEALFGSNVANNDTDSDGYDDLTEVHNFYNPAGAGPLSINPNLGVYQSNAYGYSLIYCQSWNQVISSEQDSVIFRADDNSFIQIIAQNNENGQTIEDWYREQFNLPAVDQANLVNYDSWHGVKNSDNLTIYLTDLSRRYIFTLTYNPVANNTLDYPEFFQTVIKSFTIVE